MALVGGAAVVTLTSERLRLRAVAPADVDDLVALDADPAVMRYLTGGRPTPRAAVERAIREHGAHRWVAEARDGGRFVGWFALRPSAPAEYELGYRLRREGWGRGLATEGSLALLDVAFARLGATRVWAQTMTVNRASRRVLDKCGLRHVRTFHGDRGEPIDGAELGDVEYEALASDRHDGRVLTTRRLFLRPFARSDRESLARFVDDPRYRSHLGADHPSLDAFLDHNLAVDPARERSWVAGVRGVVVGSVFLGIDTAARHGTLACLLDPAWWGRGIGTEACSAVVDLAFARLGLESVGGSARRANVASVRGMARLGMSPCGADGDVLELRVTRAQWHARRVSGP